MTLKERYDVAKQYVKDHAPEIITAAAVISLAVVVVKAQKNLKAIDAATHHMGHVVDSISHDVFWIAEETASTHDHIAEEIQIRDDISRTIRQAVKDGRDFDYYPLAGVYVHPEKKIVES